jgi:DNA polymerase III epsilon subunit-like protein
VVLDTETTGLHDPARVIELALVFVSPTGAIQDSWSTLLRGEGSAGGSRLERIHGITDAELRHAPEFREIAPALPQAFAGRVVFGHNSKFDRARLNYELGLLRRPMLSELACTMYLGKSLGYGQLRLDDAIDEFGIERASAHCAHDDALATAALLGIYIKEDGSGVKNYLQRKGFA